jgi:para-nitrobenzyl esterase
MTRFTHFLLTALVLLATVGVSCAPAAPASATLQDPIQIDSGLISGTVSDGLHIYKGIPFAAPPVGNLRWKSPQPVTPWQGVKQCSEFGPVPYQWAALGPPPTNSNEDCLYLNVWTPAKKQSDRLPVMVWLYGGGFRFGSGSTALYDGVNLANRGVIVVTLNYRVGTLGFIAHPLLSKESGHDSSGNYGILDQIAALKWVQKNIAAFGGDPNRVTIFGESAGAISVACLMASPLAKGLFQRAVSESLAELGLLAHHRESRFGIDPAEKQGERLAKDLGCDTVPDPIACMRAKSAQEVMAAGKPPADYLSPGYRYGPIVDGWLLPDLPLNIFESGKQHDVPYLLGSNADEWALFQLRLTMTADSYQAYVKKTAGEYAQQVLTMYPATNDEQAKTAEKDVLTLYAFTCPAKAYAAAMEKVATPAYLYQFTRVPPGASKLGAFHALEVGYVFGNLVPILPTPDPEAYFDNTDKALSGTMMSYWTQFAASGDPNQKGLPQWPAYKPKTDQYLELGDKIEAKSGLCTEACSLFQKIAREKRSK